MSELGKLTAAPRSDVLPGYTMSRFTLRMYGEAEEEFTRAYLATAAAASVRVPDITAQRIVDAATRNVREGGGISYGTSAFDRRALSQSSTPFLLWLSLRPKHPRITLAEATALITDENEGTVYNVVRELMGYDMTPATRDEAGDNEKKAPTTGEASTGAPSSPPSDGAESESKKSET